MPAEQATTVFRGRMKECDVLDRLLDKARAGRSSALVLRGEAGVGKTALLNYLVERASDFTVTRIAGVESEMGFPFASLLQLLGGPTLERIDELAGPQRDALRQAFGLMDGPPPEVFLVSLAALSLLSETAEDQPLVCLIDDAQWLDRESASALSFVARRLAAERIAMLFAVRQPSPDQQFDGLADLLIEGLADADARLLLDAAFPGRLDEQVRDRILAEARGNPLALLELPRGLSPAELAGGFGLPDPGDLSGRLEQSFVHRVHALPPETQRLLLVAAAEAVGDAGVIVRAATRLGVELDAVTPAEDTGLVEGGPRIRFRHPLMRSASYRAASAHERRLAHAALAVETDPDQDPDRRAWHRAHAASGPDEDVAALLERSASRACARGGVAAGAAFLEQSADLTPEVTTRGTRALAAARLKFQVGAPDAGERLLTVATATPLGALDLARVERLRALTVFVGRGSRDAAPLLSAAATQMEPHDPELARETHLEALWAAVRSGRFANAAGVVAAASAAISAEHSTRAVDLLLAGAVARITDGHELAQEAVARAVATCRAEGFSGENLASDELVGPRCWLACQLAMDIWDDASWEQMALGLSQFAREQGRLTILPIALYYSASHRLFAGELGVAGQMLREAEAIASATRGLPTAASVSALHAAWCGDREGTQALAGPSIEAGKSRGEGFAVEVGECAQAVLYNGLADYASAAVAGHRGLDPEGLGFSVWILPEMIEATIRSGDRQAAELAFERLVERSHSSTTAWACGTEAAARALLAEGPDAEAHYLEAIDQLRRSRLLALSSRAQLNYGEWLRRQGRRADARAQLKAVLAAFETMGAVAFAERARRELVATGETVRKRGMEARDALTPQEAQIARLASERLSNPEIAAQLFLSHRTVEYHLHKVFQKLGISSRKELADALRGSPSAMTRA